MAKKITCIKWATLLLSVMALSGCLKQGDNKLLGGLINLNVGSLETATSSNVPSSAAQTNTVDIYEQKKQCYKNVDCLENSTFLYHYYATSINPEQHVEAVLDIYWRAVLADRRTDAFKRREVIKDVGPPTAELINASAKVDTVTIIVPLPLSEYDFDSQSFTYQLPQSENLSVQILYEDRSDSAYDDFHKVPVFTVNFTNKEALSTLNIAEAQASALLKVTHSSKAEIDASKSLKHRYVAKGVYGNKLVMLKVKASLGKRSMTTLSDISEDKKEYKIKATILQYQLLNEAGKILKTVEL